MSVVVGSSQNINTITTALKALTSSNFINCIYSINYEDNYVIRTIATTVIVMWLVSLVLQVAEIIAPNLKKYLTQQEIQKGDNVLSIVGLIIILLNLLVVTLDSIRSKISTLDGFKV